MNTQRVSSWLAATALSLCLQPAQSVHAQAAPSPAAAADAAATEATREQLLTLLRESPTLTAVVASDPSLLGNQDYVAKSNPELAKFIGQHPEIGRNPDFYLFADIHTRGPHRVDALEKRVWTGAPEPQQDEYAHGIFNDFVPMMICLALIAAFVWLIKTLLANRRWSRIFKMQTEVHGKLIDRFGTSEEILNYMQTDAGKRFLEAAPISVEVQQQERWPQVLQRVLMPLTAGIVLTLLGVGLLVMRHSVPGGRTPFLVFGVVALMPGLGCMIAAVITWLVAQRLGLIPGNHRNGQ